MSNNTRTLATKPAAVLAMPSAEKMEALDTVANSYEGTLGTIDKPFATTLTLAVAMNSLRELLTPEVMAPIMALMNSPLGFLTDRTGRPDWKGNVKDPYTVDEVRDCIIEGTLRGFRVVGNEMNIIAGRFYGAKAGFQRKVRTYPGLTQFVDVYDIPRASGDKGAIVKCRASWLLNGKPDAIEREFPIKGDSYAGADSYLGKATRKLLSAVFEKITGQSIPEGDPSDISETEPEKNVTPKTVKAPDFTKAAERPKKKGAEPIEATTTAPAEPSAPEQPAEEPVNTTPAAATTAEQLPPHQQLSVYLAEMEVTEEWFVRNMYHMDPQRVPRNGKEVADLRDDVVAQILTEGVEPVVITLRGMEKRRGGK